MSANPSFAELLDAVDGLSIDDQSNLVEIVQNRIRDRRREALLRDIDDARQEHADGKSKPMTVDEIMREVAG